MRSLSDDARRLVSDVRGSDSGAPRVGYATLIAVARIRATETLALGPSRGVYARAEAARLTCVMTDGSVRELYQLTEGYFEGYMCEVFGSLEELTHFLRELSAGRTIVEVAS